AVGRLAAETVLYILLPCTLNEDVTQIQKLYGQRLVAAISGRRTVQLHQTLGNYRIPHSLLSLVLFTEFEREKRGIFKPAKKLSSQCLPYKRTKDLIRKVDAAANVDNPPTLDQMAERYDVSKRTIRRVLSKNLQSDLLKKTKTHALSNKQAQQRLDRGPRFLKLLGGDRWNYVVSFDEFWLSMYDCGVSYRGPTSIYFVPPTSKVNSAFFLNNIVKPIVEKDIPGLYLGEEHKVILHFDSASSHTTPAVYSYLKSKKSSTSGKRIRWPTALI
ncbi:hypothetical protein BV898_18431, partial [Hypsibius exemplaris]